MAVSIGSVSLLEKQIKWIKSFKAFWMAVVTHPIQSFQQQRQDLFLTLELYQKSSARGDLN